MSHIIDFYTLSLFVRIRSKYKIKIYRYDKKGFLFYRHFGTLIVLPPYTGDRKGVLGMETLTTLILAIVASVVSHCVLTDSLGLTDQF